SRVRKIREDQSRKSEAWPKYRICHPAPISTDTRAQTADTGRNKSAEVASAYAGESRVDGFVGGSRAAPTRIHEAYAEFVVVAIAERDGILADRFQRRDIVGRGIRELIQERVADNQRGPRPLCEIGG